jgi:hypothetical protein
MEDENKDIIDSIFVDQIINNNNGLTQPFIGLLKYLEYSPSQVNKCEQFNKSIGLEKAHFIANKLEIDIENCFTKEQFLLFISGNGIGGDKFSAGLVDASIRILTNTNGNPLYSNINGTIVKSVLGSYGLFVNEEGLLMSCGNTLSPSRQVNSVLAPGGYLDKWCKQNGAVKTLISLFRVNFLIEAYFGYQSQEISGTSQLVLYNSNGDGIGDYIGMSMCPCIWITNFYLLYLLNPSIAALLPAYWKNIPQNVVHAINSSSNGTIPYLEYEKFLN